MKVILTKDIDKVGKAGEAKDVKDGFARNLLLPKGLAVPFTQENMRVIDQSKFKQKRLDEKQKLAAQDFSDRLSKASCTVTVQVGPDDKLYGSVTSADIQKALEVEGFTVDKKAIIIEQPMDKIGLYNVLVGLHPEIKASVKVWVVKG